jgi:mono/diheme cytochrome c family protein
MKRALIGRGAVTFLIVAFAACGGGESADTSEAAAAAPAAEAAPAMSAELPEGVTMAMVTEGRELFNGSGTCFACHGQDGAGSTLGPAFNDDEWLNADGTYESIIDVINSGVDQPKQYPGVMLAKAGMSLTDEQVAALAAYVYSLSH